MARRTTEKRRLIKFSNYSMCVTLPKWVIDQLGWQKGDYLTVVTDVKQGKITLFREQEEPEQPKSAKQVSTPTTNEGGKPAIQGATPKLRW